MSAQRLMMIMMTLVTGLGLAWGVGQQSDPAQAHEPPPSVAPYQVVVEVNDPAGTENVNWAGTLNNVSNSLDEIGEDQMEVEVVAHGQGIHLLATEKSPEDLRAKIAELQDRGVVFAACANSMAKNGYTMDDMLPGVVQVPSGAAEIIRKQREGWIYLHS